MVYPLDPTIVKQSFNLCVTRSCGLEWYHYEESITYTLKHFKTTLLWVASHWFADISSGIVRECITKWLALIGKYIRTKGLVWTIKRIKLIRLVVTRYLSGSPLLKVDELLGITSDGFPKCILFLKEFIDGGRPSEIRFVLTLLIVSRAMKCEATPSYDSITAPFDGEFDTLPADFIAKFVEDFKLVLFRPTWSKDLLFFTMKGGPLGHPILTAIHALKFYDGPMWAAVVQIVGLPGAEALKALWMKYRDVIKWDIVEKKIDNLHLNDLPRDNLPLRRLSIVQDPELKARVVGIVDYFTQVILQPLGEQVFELLRSLPQDRTFTQDPHIKKLEGQRFHSVDLSNATDRFPLALQKDLLAEMLGPNFAWAWGVLMSYKEFVTPCGKSISYEVGQPIGARSSWAVFTLSHHLVVQYAAYLAGVYPFKDYILLGDDIVIANDAVAEQYVKLVTDLGVKTSPSKTHVSLTTYEFAKRWFHNGVEVTGFPVNSVLSTLNSPLELYSAVRTWVFRGNIPSIFTDSVDIVVDLLKRLRRPDRKIREIRRNLSLFRFTLRNLSQFNYDEVRSFFAQATKDHEGYAIPATEAVLVSELTRVSAAVVNGTIMGLMYKLSRYMTKVDKVVAACVGPVVDLPGGPYDLPIRVAIENSIQNLMKLGNNLSVWGDLLPLLEITTIVDIDQLEKRSRKSVMILYRMSTFGKGLYSQLRFEPDFETNITQNFRIKKGIMDLNKAFKPKFTPVPIKVP